jgi:hypothetical protein
MTSKSVTISTKVPEEFFENLPFWQSLDKDRRKTVISGTNRIHSAVVGALQLRAEVARAAAEVRAVLQEEGYWVKYLRSLESSYRSVYRWLGRLDQLALPPAVLDAAATRGIDVVEGRYFNTIKELPPPKAIEGAAIDTYLEKVARSAGRRKSRGKEPERAERDAWRAVVNQGRHVTAGRARTAWAIRLIGKLMAEFGLPGQRVEPEAVPEDFRAQVGYPKGRPRK